MSDKEEEEDEKWTEHPGRDKDGNPTYMSEETKARIREAHKALKGKEMFPEAIARARKLFKGLR